jgi:hypothetical protein
MSGAISFAASDLAVSALELPVPSVAKAGKVQERGRTTARCQLNDCGGKALLLRRQKNQARLHTRFHVRKHVS